MPATLDLAGADIELTSQVAREYRLNRAVQDFLAGTDAATGPTAEPIDYVVIDCPPSLGLLTLNALVAAREVLIPIQCEYYALEGLAQLLSTVELVRAHLNPDLAVTTVLLTMYDARTRLADQVADEVRRHFGELVLDAGHPPQRAGLRGAGLRPDGDDLRRRLARRGRVPSSRPGDRRARHGDRRRR